MGDCNLNCAISNFPIDSGAVCLFLVKNYRFNSLYAWDQWRFASLPFEVKMGDYTLPEGCLFSDGNHGDIRTSSAIDQWCYRQFRNTVYLHKQGKPFISCANKYNSSCFLGRQESGVREGSDPFFSRGGGAFDPREFSVAYVNKEVYAAITSPLEIDERYLEFYWTDPDGYLMPDLGCHQYLCPNYFADLLYQIRDFDREMADSKNLAIQKLRELVFLSHRMDRANRLILPSYHLSPQGGWLSGDCDEIVKFYRTMAKIGNKRLKHF